jgi:hypothetical protein
MNAKIILKHEEKEYLLQRTEEYSLARSVLAAALPDENQPALVVLLVMSRQRMLSFKLQNLIVALPGELCITRWLDSVFLVVIASTKRHGTRTIAAILNVISPGLMIGKLLKALRCPGRYHRPLCVITITRAEVCW